MRLKITFASNENIVLPTDYNHYIQAFIYNNISEEMAHFLHNKGYLAKGRKFKLFSFSKLFGKFTFDKQEKCFHFKPPVTLYLTTPIDELVLTFSNHILLNNTLFLAQNKLTVQNVYFERDTIEQSVVVKTLSPIVTYSTMLDMQGKKYTCYFMPGEPRFSTLICENLKKKVLAMNGNAKNEHIEIEPLGRTYQKIITYKGFVIKGCEGKFRLSGSEKLISMALNAGLGSKNSQGFGCIMKV